MHDDDISNFNTVAKHSKQFVKEAILRGIIECIFSGCACKAALRGGAVSRNDMINDVCCEASLGLVSFSEIIDHDNYIPRNSLSSHNMQLQCELN